MKNKAAEKCCSRYLVGRVRDMGHGLLYQETFWA